MFRRPGAGRSKASNDTLCQKCLKRGHYSYECKASAQERPYTSRPSRTQQLLNPKLKPKLTTDVPNDLLRKNGVANEILKKKEEDRKRSRSLSTSSADSVSTISTNRSRSKSPPRRQKHDEAAPSPHDNKTLGKRARRSISMDSRSSEGSWNGDRNTRRRMSSFSPGERGRRRSRSRSRSARMQISHDDASRQKGGREGLSRSRSGSRKRGGRWSRSRSGTRRGKRPARQTSLSRSRSRSLDRMDTSDDRNPPNGTARGRWGASPAGKAAPSQSPPPFRGGRDRSQSPYSKRKAARRSPSPQERRNGVRGRGGPPVGRNRFDDRPARPNGRPAPPPVQAPSVQRERSLSPYSKRVALTRMAQAG
ncbi:zinc knuckle-domain-containing protein [Pyrenochaeta sp. MPI-SDFR-AT-0127]|nr:zinc knuckle-domain-containing protein [Pyrenochaeta sp. MPI-SDFR-AT-0127]